MLNKILSKLIIRNVKTRKPSYTITAFVVGFGIVNLKLILSGITIFGAKMSDFNGTDYATAIAALGALYISNKHVGNLQFNKLKELNENNSETEKQE